MKTFILKPEQRHERNTPPMLKIPFLGTYRTSVLPIRGPNLNTVTMTDRPFELVRLREGGTTIGIYIQSDLLKILTDRATEDAKQFFEERERRNVLCYEEELTRLNETLSRFVVAKWTERLRYLFTGIL